jgi:large subunit ribosomal protein L10
MSKKIKQMEMDSLKKTFQGVRDMVVLSASGIDCQTDNAMRLGLRKKKIRLQIVKNSLAKRVFGELGLKIDGIWEGPTMLAWGPDSVAELSKSIEEITKKNKKLTVKKAIAEGEEITFEQALKRPTRVQAIGTILSMILGPARQIAGCIAGPASQIAGQIKTIADKKPDEAAAAAPAPAAG